MRKLMILSQTSNIKNKQKEMVVIECDFKDSESCSILWTTSYRNALNNLQINKDKIMCKYCSYKIKNSGRNNPSCIYKSLKDNMFEKIDTKEKAYCLGWIASDGSLSGNVLNIEISNRDVIHLEFIKNLICKELNIVTRTRLVKNKKCIVSYFTVCSKKIVNDCCYHLKIKPGKKCNTIQLPELSNELIWYFISGYFGGDGFIKDRYTKKKSPVATLYSNSIKMLKQIQSFTKIKSSLYRCENINTLEFRGMEALEFMTKIYLEEKFSLPRKYKRFKQWSNWIKPKLGRPKSSITEERELT